MSLLLDLVNSIGPAWGWAIVILWTTWQLYCPLPNHKTKVQRFHDDFTGRLRRIELIQIALAEEVADVNEHQVRDLHGEDGLTSSDIKQSPSESD